MKPVEQKSPLQHVDSIAELVAAHHEEQGHGVLSEDRRVAQVRLPGKWVDPAGEERGG